MNCSKPLTHRHILCFSCRVRKLYVKGLEDKRVKIGQVGRNTTNYQQYLHWSFFKCNVHVNYRGIKEDRIKAKVSDKAIEVATLKLHRALSCHKYTWLGKKYLNNNHNREIYSKVENVRNIQKRLVYNLLLYYISYHIENNPEFKTFVHFQASMLNNLLINVENTHIRVNRPKDFKYFDQKRNINKAKYWYWLFTEVDNIMKPLMNEVIGSIYD